MAAAKWRFPVHHPSMKRRSCYEEVRGPVPERESPDPLERFDSVYRGLVALLFNHVPLSGHPGGSLSAGRFMETLLFRIMDTDVGAPDRGDADVLSLAAGHKALGLYALLALRDEVVRAALPSLLPADERQRVRLEDLLGFRKNPRFLPGPAAAARSRSLDGHPTPATPFVRLATGASGVGLASSVGLALAARDHYGPHCPRIHVVEGEGGLTPGRAAEALAAAGTMGIDNLLLHVDWNQSSIDSDHVCREGPDPGDYVQWNPAELAWFHDWNVLYVPDGHDLASIRLAQERALAMDNGQPTAIVYRTTKGWRYGVQGRASHGAGHPLCSPGFYAAVEELASLSGEAFPRCDGNAGGCSNGTDAECVAQCFLKGLLVVRTALERSGIAQALARCVAAAASRLEARSRAPRPGAPDADAALAAARDVATGVRTLPEARPGTRRTLRSALGETLNVLGREGKGCVLAAAADLLDSTSVSEATRGWPAGFFHARRNPGSRTLSTGGICEDAMTGILSGVSAFGKHLAVGASYGAFLAPLGHIATRLHAIGALAREERAAVPRVPMVLVCGHAGLKTGEDGPTHADPQSLQLLQENFPRGTVVTLTPWEPAEVGLLLCAALLARPAAVAAFVTRPPEEVLDRVALGLAPAHASTNGVYLLARVGDGHDATVVLQGSEVAYAFVQEALPELVRQRIRVTAYYVASVELFDLLPPQRQEAIFPEAARVRAMGITGFTMPTLYRWVCSHRGRQHSLHPFREGHYMGSGPARDVVAQAGLDGASQVRAIQEFLRG